MASQQVADLAVRVSAETQSATKNIGSLQAKLDDIKKTLADPNLGKEIINPKTPPTVDDLRDRLDKAGKELEGMSKTIDQTDRDLFEFSRTMRVVKGVAVGFTATIGAISAAIGAAGLAFVALGKKSLDSFMEGEVALGRLTAAIKINGAAADALVQDYVEFSQALSDVVKADDVVIQRMLQTAESFGSTGEAAKLAVKEAIGLSHAFQVSERTAIRLTTSLAKGVVGPMSLYLDTLRAIEDPIKRAEKAHELLADEFLNAQTAVKSLTGQLNELDEAWVDIKESFGESIAAVVKPLVETMVELARSFRALPQSVKQTIVVIGTFTAALAGIIASAAAVGAGIAALLGVVAALGLSLSGLAIGAIAGIAAALLAIEAAAVAVAVAWANWDSIVSAVKAVWEIIKRAWDTIKDVFGQIKERIMSELVPAFLELMRVIRKAVVDAFKSFGISMKDTSSLIDVLIRFIGDQLVVAISSLAKTIKFVAIVFEGFVGTIKAVAGWVETLYGWFIKLGQFTPLGALLIAIGKGIGEEYEEAANKAQKLRDEQEAAAEAAKKAGAAQKAEAAENARIQQFLANQTAKRAEAEQKAAKARAEQIKKVSKAASDTAKEFREQIALFGQEGRNREISKLMMQGASPEQVNQLIAMDRQLDSMEAHEERRLKFVQDQQAAQEKIKSILDRQRTPVQVLVDKIDEINKLSEDNLINERQRLAAIAALKKEHIAATEAKGMETPRLANAFIKGSKEAVSFLNRSSVAGETVEDKQLKEEQKQNKQLEKLNRQIAKEKRTFRTYIIGQ